MKYSYLKGIISPYFTQHLAANDSSHHALEPSHPKYLGFQEFCGQRISICFHQIFIYFFAWFPYMLHISKTTSIFLDHMTLSSFIHVIEKCKILYYLIEYLFTEYLLSIILFYIYVHI